MGDAVGASKDVAEVTVVTHLGGGAAVHDTCGVEVGTSGLAAFSEVT